MITTIFFMVTSANYFFVFDYYRTNEGIWVY
jgi:hypothetical protein